MSVHEFPPPRFDERVMRLALAAVIRTLKDSRRSTRRCRRRLLRAVGLLEDEAPITDTAFADDTVSATAATWLRHGCEVCRRCPGV